MRFRLNSHEKARLRQAHTDINDARRKAGKRPFRFIFMRVR